MAIRGLLARLGAGGASVDTVLDSPVTVPGGSVGGQVHVTGGSTAQDVNEIRVSLEATVEVESGDGEWLENVTFGTTPVAGSFRLEPGEQKSLPFAFPVPWQCPFTSVGGWTLRGMRLGVRTRVDVPGAVDPGDLDALSVEPLPVQTAVLQALEQLGFGFRRADVERGRLRGSDLPFYQEVEFAPPAHLRRSIDELEVTFLAEPAGVDVVLEVDRRGGLLTEGRDAAGRLRVQHHDTAASVSRDLDAAVQQLGRRRGWL